MRSVVDDGEETVVNANCGVKCGAQFGSKLENQGKPAL